MTKLDPASSYEMNLAAAAAAQAFLNAQEAYGPNGIWFPLKDGWRHFGERTTFKHDAWDAGYPAEDDVWGDLGFIKQFAGYLRGHILYVAPRTLLAGSIVSSVWVRRSLFLDHLEERRVTIGSKDAKTKFDLSRKWNYGDAR